MNLTAALINPANGTLSHFSVIDIMYLQTLDKSLLQGSAPEIILARQLLEGEHINTVKIERAVVDGISYTSYQCSSSNLRLMSAWNHHTRFLVPLEYSRHFNKGNTLLYKEDERGYYFESLPEVTFVYKGRKMFSGKDNWDAYISGSETPVHISISRKYRNKNWVTFAGYAYILRSLLCRKLYLPHYGVEVSSGIMLSALTYHYHLSCERISDPVERQDHLKTIAGHLDSLPLIQILIHDMVHSKDYALYYNEDLPIEVTKELLRMPYLGKKFSEIDVSKQ